MKKLIFSLLVVLTAAEKNYAQSCSFVSPTVDIISTQQQANGDCKIVFNLAVDISTNSGNKFIFVHLWKVADYPAYDYNQPGNTPPKNATALSNTIVNVAIDNFSTTPTLLTGYGPDNTVVIQSPANNPSITVSKTVSVVAGADRFVIKNISILVPNTVCGNSLVFKGDAWSSNSNASGAKVQCAMTGFAVGITDPLVDGVCQNAVLPATFSFSIRTVSPSVDIYYDVYMDNGNNLFDPANDVLLSSVGSGSAITITPLTPFNSGPQNYPSPIFSESRKVFVAVHIVGKTYLVSTEIIQCSSLLPVSMSSFTANKMKGGVLLEWTTESEQNNAGFEVQRQTGGEFKTIAYQPSAAAGGNSNTPLHYTFNDAQPLPGGWVYYRLKQINFDGHYTYSEIRKVMSDRSDEKMILSPNPATGGRSALLIPQSFGRVDIIISDSHGKTIRSISNTAEKKINIENLSAGFYIIRAADKTTGAVYAEKLVVAD